jgi:hypothetical protein
MEKTNKIFLSISYEKKGSYIKLLNLKMKRKKNSFILLEIIISMSLVAIILTVLFQFYTQIIITDKKIEKAKTKVFARQHLHLRLHTIFSQIIPPFHSANEFYTSHFHSFLTDKKITLEFFFNNGIDPDPLFSGIIIGRLFYKDNCLKMKIFPTDKNEKIFREEILIKNIKNYKIFFLGKKENEIGEIQSISKDFSWLNSWKKNKHELPLYILISVKDCDNKKFVFAFFLSYKQSANST